MPITLSTVLRARWFPELLPDAQVLSLPASGAAAALDLRRFAPFDRLLTLTGVATDQDADVQLQLRVDGRQYDALTGMRPARRPAEDRYVAADSLSVSLKNLSASAKSGYRVSYGLWVSRPTVAEKLRWGLELSAEETELATKLGIPQSAEKGILPLPVDYQLLREYHQRAAIAQTAAQALAVPVEPAYAVAAQLFAEQGEALILRGIAADPGTQAQAVKIIIDRDEDGAYLTLDAYALPIPAYGDALDWELPCFLPALHELRVRVTAAQTVPSYRIRLLVWRVPLTNLLRARWGLPPAGQPPADLADRVRAGVL